jgi:predicted transcriptional regulator
MQQKTAGDIMIPLDEYPHIPYWLTLRQAIAEFDKSEIVTSGKVSRTRFVLVFDEEYQLLGTVRRRDILRGLEPDFLKDKPLRDRKMLFNKDVFAIYSFDKLVDGVRKQADMPVKDVMMPIVVTVDSKDHIIKAMYEMVDHNVSIIPVVDEEKVVGVLRSNDVFHELARMLL